MSPKKPAGLDPGWIPVFGKDLALRPACTDRPDGALRVVELVGVVGARRCLAGRRVELVHELHGRELGGETVCAVAAADEQDRSRRRAGDAACELELMRRLCTHPPREYGLRLIAPVIGEGRHVVAEFADDGA